VLICAAVPVMATLAVWPAPGFVDTCLG
jgi:hypothetical protein